MDGQIPPVFYRTLSPLGPLPCSPSTKITCYSSKARVPLTTYCLWAAISITFSFQHIHFVKMFFFSPFSFNCFFHTIQFSCPILCESNFLVSFVAQSENFSQHSCSCLWFKYNRQTSFTLKSFLPSKIIVCSLIKNDYSLTLFFHFPFLIFRYLFPYLSTPVLRFPA